MSLSGCEWGHFPSVAIRGHVVPRAWQKHTRCDVIHFLIALSLEPARRGGADFLSVVGAVVFGTAVEGAPVATVFAALVVPVAAAMIVKLVTGPVIIGPAVSASGVEGTPDPVAPRVGRGRGGPGARFGERRRERVISGVR